ncbi:protein PAXX isoform X2 [Pteronotus mesoamericanus]|uniref:protein PAXX isoform X2 n=1 Tax=Pteronotus mesoamericanus TaxID=1884717 RepID=UPI0023EE0C57|nr:protein PAXX isoform X2 [Pteronotus parnellii mesoamericanus]
MVPPPPPLPPPLCTLPPGPGPPRFICYCEKEEAGASGRGGFSLYVTDGAALWSTCFTPDGLAALKARFGLSAAEDVTPRFRAAFKQQAVAFTLQEDGASLTLAGGPSALGFELSKVPDPEAASRLQALTLGLAERVCSLERQLACRTRGGHPQPPWGPPAQAFIPGSCPQLWRRRPPAPGRALGQRGPQSSYQIQILREAALDLGSGGGVLESPSSTLASKETSQWCGF